MKGRSQRSRNKGTQRTNTGPGNRKGHFPPCPRAKKRASGPEDSNGPERKRNQRDRRNENLPGGSYGRYSKIRETIVDTTRHMSDPSGQVVNLSKTGYTVYEYKLLGYNLNFVPTPENINKKEILQDVKKFNRKIKLKAHFGTSLPEGNLYFKSQSEWEPSNVHHTVKTFTEDFKNRVTQSIKKTVRI